jgi:hypothetical protein
MYTGLNGKIAKDMVSSVAVHGESVMHEITQIIAHRERDRVSYAQLCAIKSIMSVGARLEYNIDAALKIHYAMRQGFRPRDRFDLKPFLAHYGTLSYAANCKNLIASWDEILELDGSVPTWDERPMYGQGDKVRAWNIALFDPYADVFTLDRHMLRGIFGNDKTPKHSEYKEVMQALIALHRRIFGDNAPPLMSQWSMWNEYRHKGIHASHLAILGNSANIAIQQPITAFFA